MANRNLFITGATGKIGLFLVDQLRKRDYIIRVLDNSGISKRNMDNITYVSGDILDPGSYASHLKDVEVVVHMAGVTHTNRAERYYDINARGTRELLHASRKNGVRRFIFLSTRAIAEDGGDYSRSKFIAENYVRESGIEWVILRLAEVYGIPGGKGVDILLRCIDRLPFIPIIGKGLYKVCPVHVKDAVFAIEQVISRSGVEDRIYTIAGPESYTYTGLADALLKARRLRKPKIYIPVSLMNIALRMSALIFGDRFLAADQMSRLISEKSDDISAARRYLSFNPGRITDMIGAA
jgi:nucleoside-diphosphate-sugar epimerase